ncbi:MAG: NADH-quinone oxidoreductase subunit L [Saprospiraceae bacterium]|nr:NADH-quinone oxidoreductase subunit L [Saprospiraceae bacterium]
MISILIPILPLLGFLIHVFLKNNISEKLAGLHSSGWVIISFILSCVLFVALNSVSELQTDLFTWMNVGNLNVPMAFLIDHLSILMMLIITGIGSLIHIYSIGYMHGDKGFNRFFSYLNLFIFFMLILVMSNNYVMMFVGWEGVGLCSYLLIGFWFKNQDFNDAANKAFIMNRIGDLAFLLGLFVLFQHIGTLTFKEIFAAVSTMSIDTNTMTIITMLLFIGACGKSAQIPLFTWLPDAMAGPTPVSALIHAATMVTAGIYMIVRSNLLFSMTPITLETIMIIGIATSIFAGTIAIKQNDIKKVLAYSTVSQLGLMFFAIGLGAYEAAFFHLVTHAFFKALLFLGAGSIIHSLNGQQDIRKMGGIRHHLKITHAVFATGVMAIIALPPFAGFFSKDGILTTAFNHNPGLWGIGLISGIITSFYMMRLYYLVFWGKPRLDKETIQHIHESPAVITVPLIILAILSIIGGWINIPELFKGNQILGNYLGSIIPTNVHDISHSTEWILIGITNAFTLIIILYTYVVYVGRSIVPETDLHLKSGIGRLLTNKYYIDELYQIIIINPFKRFTEFLYHIIDIKVIDGIINGVSESAHYFSNHLRKTQNGNISYYLFVMALGMGSILIYILLS